MKILIVGAGPTGLTAALKFIKNGIIPEIVDAKKSPSKLSRAVGILPETIEKMKTLDVGEEILKQGIALKKLIIHLNNQVLIDLDIGKVLKSVDMPVFLPQDKTETIMSHGLSEKGVNVQYNRKVTDIQNNDDGVWVEFSDGTSDIYDWVIGADGVRSTVREKLSIRYQGYELPEIWSIADVELEDEQYSKTASAWIMEREETDIIVMVPIGEKMVRLVSSTPDSVQALPLKLNILNIKRQGTFKISIRQAESYVRGRVLLAGDAAHAHSPVGGRGMNLGIDDALHAVDAILQNNTQEYKKMRQQIGADIIRTTERARKAMVSRNIFVKGFVKMAFFLMRNFPNVARVFMKKMVVLN